MLVVKLVSDDELGTHKLCVVNALLNSFVFALQSDLGHRVGPVLEDTDR